MKPNPITYLVTGSVIAAVMLAAVAALAAPRAKVGVCHAAGRAGTTHFVYLEVPANDGGFPQGHYTESGSPLAGHEDDYLTEGTECTTQEPTTTTTTIPPASTTTTTDPNPTTTTAPPATSSTTTIPEPSTTTTTQASSTTTPTTTTPTSTSIVRSVTPTPTRTPATTATPSTTTGTSTPTTTPPAELPRTGASSVALAALATFLVAAGGWAIRTAKES